MKTIKYFICIALIYSSSSAIAQVNKTSYCFSNGVELGSGSEPGVYAQLFLAVQKHTDYLKIKNSSMQELLLFGDKPNPKIFDYSLIYGKSYTIGRLNNFQIGAGLAYTGKVMQGKYLRSGGQENSGILLFGHGIYEKVMKSTIGLPIEIKYNFLFSKLMSLNISANANLNSVKSFTSFSAGFTLGRLRD